jgi:5S rRNA maturation endonuclease (ribonuclease M5)
MDVETVATILRGIGAEQVRIASTAKVVCCCPLAWWTHTKGADRRPSMVVFVGDSERRPYYSCLACHDRGTLRNMLLFLWTRGHDVFRWVEVLDGEAPVEKARTKAEKLKAAFKRDSRQGFHPLMGRSQHTSGKPFYDYRAVEEAEKEIEELPEDVYKPYAGSVPPYALDRGLTLETCKEWELGHDKKTKRLLFPIWDRKGRLVAISGRIYVDDCPRCGGIWIQPCGNCGLPESEHNRYDPPPEPDGMEYKDRSLFCVNGSIYQPTRACCTRCGMMQPPKYLHSKGFPRKFIMYGEHRQEQAPDGRVYVVEGHLDMIKMWQFGYRPVMALLGSHPSPPQVEKLIKYWQKIIVVPDGNQAGREMGERVKKMVAARVPITVKKLVEGTDPGKMTEEELYALLGPPPFAMAA